MKMNAACTWLRHEDTLSWFTVLPWLPPCTSGSRSRVQSRCNSRNTFRSNANSPSRPCSRQSHSCVNISQDTNNQNSQVWMMFLKTGVLRITVATKVFTYQGCDSTLACINCIQSEEYRDQNMSQVLAYRRKKTIKNSKTVIQKSG